MNCFLYSLVLQWKLDIRSKSLLVTFYIVPLLFFLIMGGIFTSVMPGMGSTLIQSMIVMSVSMGAFLGLPPSLVEIYGSDIKKIYNANGVPIYLGLLTMVLSAFVHLMMTSIVILLLAPILFKASLPTQLPIFLLSLTIYIIVSLSIGCILGLTLKNQAKLTMLAQLVFLPSIMLSGIMFPISLLPDFLQVIGHVFPAYWGYRLMLDKGLRLENLWYLILVSCIAVITCILLMNKQKSE
ncbi:ABC transporter [Streptococcus sp. HMSC067H01]|uniref:ABC transporter permease n=1 Tax=Streptococcus sp. HMSC067H01 TaxID=1739491 RepID=UPI0008C636AC|nr:ABC transporter permease [Streptococcus sp. HMSC067H01]OFP42144.1 ABC transporter [Streptococcus sp. HMSC067H01]